MSKASILIVEDEPLIADDVAETLEKHGFTISGIADEADDALRIVNENETDIALLDINIEGDRDGIDLAPLLKIPFIFLTSYYDQKTLDRAKVVQPSGYIVKPFNEWELVANIEMALSRIDGNIQTSHKKPEKLFVRNEQEIVSVQSDEIVYVEAFDNYAKLYTEGAMYIISHTLKSIEDKLIPHGFMRIHRSFLINFASIDSISENSVYLKGQRVQIGKSYRKDFFERLEML